MSEELIQHGVFEITSVGKTQRYFAENIGGVQDVLPVLHIISIDMHRAPRGSVIDVNQLIPLFEKAQPADPDSRLPMFEFLEQDAYERRMAELENGNTSLAQYVIDYDHSQFSVTSWDDNKLLRLSASLDRMLGAYCGAMRFVDPIHYVMDGHALVAAVEKIAEVQTIREGPSPDQITGLVM